MRDNYSTIQLWVCSLLIVTISPLAVYFGGAWDWTPGAAALMFLAVPVCAAASTGHRTGALLTAALASAGCIVEAAGTSQTTGVAFAPGFALFACTSLFVIAAIVGTISKRLRDRLRQLEEQNTQYVRDLYRRERDASASDPEESAPAGGGKRHTGDAGEDESAINYPLLLLTLQDVGRRVSTSLDMDTLLPTIVSTAKASLKCGRCDVFLWNAREESLSNAVPARQRDANSYVPRPKVGMTGWVLEHRQILTRRTVEEDYAMRGVAEEEPKHPDAIAPLSVGGELLGLLVVDDVEEDSQNFVRLLYVLGNIYALGVKNAQLFKRIEEMARRDGLTGLLNHASFQQELQGLLEKASAASTPLTVVMSDIDHFKKFNDTHGHQAGDEVLRHVARLWKAVLPDYAVLARYGGEEFICALPGDDLSRGRELAELLRETTEQHTVDFEGLSLKVTSSFGVSEFGRPGRVPQDLIKAADEALYDAKKSGRNRVVAGGERAAAEPAARAGS